MSKRGPKPLPKNVLQLRGSWRGNIPPKDGAVDPTVELPRPPKWLLPAALKEWKRIGAELEKLGLVSKIDRAALALYCQAWGWLEWHEERLQRDIEAATVGYLAHEAAEAAKAAQAETVGATYIPQAWRGGNGYMLPTPNGNLSYNPHWVARNKSAAEVDKFLASFGMSPSSRGRVTPSKQLSLFETGKPSGGWEDF
jgi:phage terminase small subunit